MRTEILHQTFGNGPVEKTFRFGGMISTAAENADLVLHLSHQDSLLLPVGFLQMSH